MRKDSTVALSGEAADEVFGGYRWFHTPETVNAATFPWMQVAPTFTSVLTKSLADELRMAEYEADSYRQALEAIPTLPGQTGHEKRMREFAIFIW